MTELTWKIFWRNIIKPWFVGEEKKFAILGFVALVILSFVSVYIAVISNEWMRDFFNSISEKNLANFQKLMIVYIPLLVVLLTDFCTRQYIAAWYGFRWRKWKTEKLQAKWTDNKCYYKIPLQNNKIVDNPDQRITNDVAQVTYGVVGLFQTFFNDGINFITFAVILWGLSADVPLELFGISIAIPGFLVWVAMIYSLVGIIITLKIGKPIIKLDRIQEQYEANFRYGLMRINERREEVASLSGENIEKNRLKNLFVDVTTNYYQILKRKIYINLFQNFYLNIQMFVPLFIVCPAYFGGAITMGVMMQIRSIFMEISGSLMAIVTSYINIASLIASMQRIVHFENNIATVENEKNLLEYKNYIDIKNVILNTQEGQKIWAVPHIQIKAGEHRLLMAQSGTGKTSLLRAMAGLSNSYSGVIILPENMMFLPQRSYMPIGTLRTALSYPSFDKADDELIPLMKKAYLEHLIPMLDEVEDYQNTLSAGEQQRVNFVRVMLHKPKWLMMDEPFSNLNEDYVEGLCKLLKTELKDSGILIITHAKLPGFTEVIKG
jgi:putative ATP-binding cassette transporter